MEHTLLPALVELACLVYDCYACFLHMGSDRVLLARDFLIGGKHSHSFVAWLCV